MTSEQKPSEEALRVWNEAYMAWDDCEFRGPVQCDEAAARVIDAAIKARDEVGEPVASGDDLSSFLSKAVGDISALLIIAGRDADIQKWTAGYVDALNRHDEQLTETPLYKRAAPDERAQIVKWLRSGNVPDHSDEGGCPFDKAARMIERGDHLPKAPETNHDA